MRQRVRSAIERSVLMPYLDNAVPWLALLGGLLAALTSAA